MTSTAAVYERLSQVFDDTLSRYLDFLRIPSISTEPSSAPDVKRAAEWVAKYLRDIGFSVEIHATPRHPVVLARHAQAASGTGPHVMYYGHYDVQPIDPIELWHNPPFEPALVEGPYGPRVVARGATDDKGQVMTFLEALRAWKEVHGSFPMDITVLIEGEEEIGSPSLPSFLEKHAAELRKVDVAVITDTRAWDVETPAITYRLRGIMFFEVTVEGPSHDLHSGMYGGAVSNPINVLCDLMAGLHDEAGRIQIPGFYDAVRKLSDAEKSALKALGFDEKAFLDEAGVAEPFASAAEIPLVERIWMQPACDITGISGGYYGPGTKSIIPQKATAKLSFRIVPDQDPKQIARNLEAFLQSRLRAGCRLSIKPLGGDQGVIVPVDGPYMQAARAALLEVFGKPAALIGSGGSIPVVRHFKEVLNVDSILLGFSLSDDRAHSPNEKFEVICLKNGAKAQVAFIEKLAECGAGG